MRETCSRERVVRQWSGWPRRLVAEFRRSSPDVSADWVLGPRSQRCVWPGCGRECPRVEVSHQQGELVQVGVGELVEVGAAVGGGGDQSRLTQGAQVVGD